MVITYILFEKPNVENVMRIHKAGGSANRKWVGGASIQMRLGTCADMKWALRSYEYSSQHGPELAYIWTK